MPRIPPFLARLMAAPAPAAPRPDAELVARVQAYAEGLDIQAKDAYLGVFALVKAMPARAPASQTWWLKTPYTGTRQVAEAAAHTGPLHAFLDHHGVRLVAYTKRLSIVPQGTPRPGSIGAALKTHQDVQARQDDAVCDLALRIAQPR